jgi:integrase
MNMSPIDILSEIVRADDRVRPLAVRAVPRQRRSKSAKAVTGDILAKLLATCSGDGLRDVRDRAILMGRLRLRRPPAQRSRQPACRTTHHRAPIPRDDGPPLFRHPSRPHQESSGSHDEVVYLTGRPVEALNVWLAAAKIESGSVFRGIDRWGNVSRRALDPKAVNDIVKQRVKMAGLEVGEFSAHGIRSGYLTEAANRGIPLPEAMEQSRHRSVQQASSYYNDATWRSGRAVRML